MTELFQKMQNELKFDPTTAPEVNLEEFKKVLYSRRSVRVYDGTPIPPEVMHSCLDMALAAPNSSNLQPWEFYWVRTAEAKKKLAEACLSQPAATSAAEMVVCVARTRTWKRNRKLMLQAFAKQGDKVPKSVLAYYKKIVPIVYTQGPWGVVGLIKKVLFFARGFVTPTPREPTSQNQMRIWAIKTVALACENLMLAFRAHGFDSCPMEGFDSVRIKSLLQLPSDAEVVMVVSAGKRAPQGVYGPQMRFDRSLFVKEV